MPISIPPFTNVPAPDDPVKSAWAQQLTTYVAPTAWTAPTLTNLWVNFDAAHPTQYRKVGDSVEVRGLIKSGTISSPAFTLPIGFRPFQEQSYATVANNLFGMVTINTSGTVVPMPPTSNAWCYLAFRFSTVA